MNFAAMKKAEKEGEEQEMDTKMTAAKELEHEREEEAEEGGRKVCIHMDALKELGFDKVPAVGTKLSIEATVVESEAPGKGETGEIHFEIEEMEAEDGESEAEDEEGEEED